MTNTKIYIFIPNNRRFHSSSTLNPIWIVGFTDAEGCFTIILSKRKQKYKITAYFEINLHTKDLHILESIQNFFNTGHIYHRKDKQILVFRVTKLNDLVIIIIPFFLNILY
jgi:hypothetical protein